MAEQSNMEARTVNEKDYYTEQEMMNILGITQADVDAVGDVEIE